MKPIPLLASLSVLTVLSLLLASCEAAPTTPSAGPIHVLAVETFLADITQNIAGERLKVDALLPPGADPHAFQPTPQDVARLAGSQVLIVNGAGYETWLAKTLDNAGGQRLIVQASAGLTARTPGASEAPDPGHSIDPHFWMDPNNVITYVENIRGGLAAADPGGADIYAKNAADYVTRLKELDTWVRQQVQQIPPEKRLLVTNHDSLGYFADRYGFAIAGTVIPGTSSEAAPSAQQMAALIDIIKKDSVRAIFLESGANPQLAQQVAQETGARVVTDLYTESTSLPGGAAPDYISMIRYDASLLSTLK